MKFVFLSKKALSFFLVSATISEAGVLLCVLPVGGKNKMEERKIKFFGAMLQKVWCRKIFQIPDRLSQQNKRYVDYSTSLLSHEPRVLYERKHLLLPIIHQ